MISVVVAADESDKAFRQFVRTMLEQNFSTLCAWGDDLEVPGTPPEVLLTDVGSFSRISADPVLYLFKRGEIQPPPGPAGGQRRVAVVDSRDPSLLTYVAGTRLPAITCGLSPKDTITLSSIGADNAVVNLQREVTCFDGSVAEPQEIPVRMGRRPDPFAIMAIASIFILSGKIDRLLEI